MYQRFLRENPWVLYTLLWTQWVILNFIGPGAWIGPTVLRQLISGPTTELNIVFPVTWTSAVISFLFIILFLWNRTSLIHSIPISAASQFGAAFLFEFTFSFAALYRHGHPILQGDPIRILLGISWLIMLFSGIGYWSKNKILFISMGIFILGFLIWTAIGFPILSGVVSITLNYITKIAAFSIIASLYIEGSFSRGDNRYNHDY